MVIISFDSNQLLWLNLFTGVSIHNNHSKRHPFYVFFPFFPVDMQVLMLLMSAHCV